MIYLTFKVPVAKLQSLVDTQDAEPIYNELDGQWQEGFKEHHFRQGRFDKMLQGLTSDPKSMQVNRSVSKQGMQQVVFNPSNGEVCCWCLRDRNLN